MMLIALLVVSTFTQPADPAALMREGFTLLEKNQNAGAVAAFHACLARAQAQADRLLEGECTRGLGRAAQARRDFVTARGLFESAHAMLAAIGNQPALGRSYNDRAFLAYLESRWPDVRELYGRAAEAFAAAGMRPEQAAALRSLTFAQDLTVAEKIRVLDGAHALAVESGATRIEALVLHMWGDMLFMQGEYATSIEKTERAVALLEPLDDPASLARALTSLGRLYRVHGAPQRAIDVYRRILATQERASDIGGQAQTHNAIASALSVLEKHAEALGHLRRALELATVEGSKSLIQFQTSAYAFGLSMNGRYEEAAAAAQQAIDLDPASSDAPVYYRNLALALAGLGRVADADAAASVAIERARHGGTPEWEITTLIERASLFEKASRPGAALADLEAATVAIEHRRAKLAPSDFLKRGFADQYQTVMSRTIALLNAAGRPRDAMMLAEQGRARAFLDLLASRESAASITLSTTNTPPASADRSASAIEGLTLRGGAAPGRDATDLASVASAQGPTQQTLQSAASRLKSTLLMYWVADDATLVWVLPPTGTVTSRRIAITRSRLERLVRRTWSLSPGALARRGFDDEPTDAAAPAAGDRALPFVTMRGGDPMRSSGLESSAYRELYDLLIAPIRDALPKTPESLLTIVPHGPLFELSFAALADARGRYLLEDHRLHYAPSAATLEFTARRAEQPQRNSRYLFVANPATTVQVAAQPLAALPGAEREVRAVSRLVGASRSTTFSGKAASEDAIRGAIGQYRVVHFATHGLVSSDNPFESFLALAPGAGGDGRLTAAEIHEMTITADLVVLSACRAAGGKISGDGIVGLSRAFFTAGTPSIVAALWDMADESAEHLLPRFYADWQKTGDKGRALRSAQLSMLRDLRAGKLTVQTPFGALVLPPHPALWANLILIGEPR